MSVYCVSLQTPLLNEILVPLIKNNTSVDRSYPSGSPSRRTIACKLSDILYIIAQRIGVDLLRLYLTEPLRLFFAVFTVSSASSDQTAAEAASSSEVVKSDNRCRQTVTDHKGIVVQLNLISLSVRMWSVPDLHWARLARQYNINEISQRKFWWIQIKYAFTACTYVWLILNNAKEIW